MKPVKIAICPSLSERWGPEIHWAWRIVFSTIGLPWCEVPLSKQADLAYVPAGTKAKARVTIQAHPEAWDQRLSRRLAGLRRCQDLLYPFYQDEDAGAIGSPLSSKGKSLVCARDLIFDLFWLATGQEEKFAPKDTHGYCDFTESPVANTGILRRALGSGFCRWLAQQLPHKSPEVWPEGKTIAVVSSHDVDYPQVKRLLEPARALRRLGVTRVREARSLFTGSLHHWHFQDWMEHEKALDTRSAFYFTSHQGSLLRYAAGTPDPFYDVSTQPFRELFREMSGEGFEIGLHASYNAYQSKEMFAAEKTRLEEAADQEIPGLRHHYWHMAEDCEETLLMHEKLGFEYDASLAHDRYMGWRRGLCHPFFPFHQAHRRELKTLQLSTSWMDDHLFAFHRHNPGSREQRLESLLEVTLERSGLLLMDVHQYVYDDTLFPGMRACFHHLWDSLPREQVWTTTPLGVARYWRERYQNLLSASEGLEMGVA